MSSSYRLELNKWLAQLDVKADRVLDIGGSQEALKPRVKSWDVKEFQVADLANPHKDSPKPDIELDLNVGYWKPMETELFDTVFCLEVFDYIYDPVHAIRQIEIVMMPGATAWITFPSIYPLHQPIEDDALRYMPGGIRKLAASAGLEIQEMIPRRFESSSWQQTVSAERMRAAKHEDHNFSGWIVRFTK